MKMTIHNNRDKTRGTSRKSGGDGAARGEGEWGTHKSKTQHDKENTQRKLHPPWMTTDKSSPGSGVLRT